MEKIYVVTLYDDPDIAFRSFEKAESFAHTALLALASGKSTVDEIQKTEFGQTTVYTLLSDQHYYGCKIREVDLHRS